MYIKLQFFNLWKTYVMGLFPHEREPFYIGKTRIETVELIEDILVRNNFQPDYFAWKDKQQVTSMRILYVDKNNEWRQVHVRVFSDRSVTIHDEVSYEEDIDRHVDGDTLRMPAQEVLALVIRILEIVTEDSK